MVGGGGPGGADEMGEVVAEALHRAEDRLRFGMAAHQPHGEPEPGGDGELGDRRGVAQPGEVGDGVHAGAVQRHQRSIRQ